MSLPNPDLKEIEILNLTPNDYNPQEMPKDKYKGLVAHMRSVGFTDPLKVRPKGAGDPDDINTDYILVDGEHRLRAFMEVFPDAKTIMCAIMKGPSGQPLTRQEAIISTIAYNFQHGEENPIKMAAALKLALDSGVLIEDIEDLTGMKRNRLESFMEFDNLPDPEQNLPDFSGGQEGVPTPKDPIIMSFAVYPDMRDVIEKALLKARADLPSEVDMDEERGQLLLILARSFLGEPLKADASESEAGTTESEPNETGEGQDEGTEKDGN